jgi:hypothetical protein
LNIADQSVLRLTDSDITSLESRDTQDTRTSYQTAGEESDLEDDKDDQAGPEEQ